MAAILKRTCVALLLLAVASSAFAQHTEAGFKRISSEADFWRKFTPTVRLYADDPKIASGDEMTQLSSFLKGSPHHWFVILLAHIDGDAFVGKMRDDLVDNPIFQNLTDGGTPDANVVLIARLSTWTKAQPHYAIRVYTGPWMEQRGLGADSATFYSSILPDMKRVSNANGPAEGSRTGIDAFDRFAKGRTTSAHALASGYSGPSSIDMMRGIYANPNPPGPDLSGFAPFLLFGFVFTVVLISACIRAFTRTTMVGPGTHHHNWDQPHDAAAMNQAMMNQAMINQSMMSSQASMSASSMSSPSSSGGGSWGGGNS